MTSFKFLLNSNLPDVPNVNINIAHLIQIVGNLEDP